MWFVIISLLISIANVNTLVPIGAGLDGLRDWSRSRPYVNLVRQARPWGSPSAPYDNNATYDPVTGWPTSDFGITIATDNLDLGGKYLLSAKGNASVSVPGDHSAYITDQTYDPSTNTLTAYVNIEQGQDQLFLSFRNTTGPGLQDIAFLQPGYNITAKSNITKLLLVHLSRFSILRFMDWTGTNNNPEMNWNDTTPVDWPQYAMKNNPWQTIPFIINQIDKPPAVWINIPHNATDDYILNVARIMFSELNPTSNIYVEYSNEVWNWGFRQAGDNLRAANYSVLHDGDPHQFNYDNCSNPGYWAWRRTAYQIKHVSDLFKTVFGEENVGPWKRVRPILAGFIALPFVIRNGLEYLNTVFGQPSNFLHGMAGAPYFNLGDFSSWTNLTTDQVLDAFNISIQGMAPERGWGQKNSIGAHAVYAAWYNLAFHGYEGGPDTGGACGECSLEAKINATRDPRMTDICVTYLNGWYRYGFQELNWFVAGAHKIGKSGSWAILEDMRQEILIDTTSMFNSTSPVAQLPRPPPKLKAVDQVHQSRIEMNFGIPIPALNINATNFAEHREPYPDPYLRYLAANSTFYYPLKITQSPIRINITVYTSENSSTLEGGINNEQFVKVQTSKTADWEVFEPAPVMQFYINQTVVPSIVTFRLKTFEFRAYNIRSFDVVLATD
jgi:hypothetical protein